MVKKLFAIILTICMVITMLPQIAFMAVQYPQEVTVFDSGVTSFIDNAAGLRNDFGVFKITSAENNAFDESGNIVLGGNANSGAQFEVDSTSDKLKTLTKNGAILKISVSVKINESAANKDDKPIISLRDGNNATLNLFEYNSKKDGETPQFRGFSWNQRETTLDKETLSGAEFSVNLKLNTKNGNGDASFTYKQKDSTEAKQVTYKTLDLNAATANVSGNGVKFNTLWANSPKLLRFYLSKNDTLKSVKINLTDLSTDSLYASINTAANAEEVKEVLDYYSKNSSFSYGDRFDELSDSEKTVIYGRFINQNFTSDSEVQALFDRLVAKQFSIVTKTYTYDFEDGSNPFSQGSIQTLSDGNHVYVPLNGGANQLRPANLANAANGPVVTEYDYCYNGDGTSGYGIAFRYLAGNSAYYLNQFTRFSNFVLYGQKAVTPQHLGYKAFYRIRQSLDVDTLSATLSAKEKSADGDYTQFTFDESTIYTPYNTSTGNPFTESIGKIAGIDFRTERTDDYVDNITIKVYNPVYTALSYTETADEVKNVFDTYKSIGALDVEDNLGEEVYSQFRGSSYTSTASLEAAIKVAAQFAALGRDVYVYDTHVKSGDTALDSEFEAGTITYGAKAYTDTAGTVVTLVIAQYKDKELTNLTYAEKTLAQGINDISDSLTVSESAGTTIKVFAVDKNANPYVVHKLLTGK